jgi:ubiquinone/menaquinone biosynthesis C-methylase UbiE
MEEKIALKTTPVPDLDVDLEKKMRAYYRDYYHVSLGLPDWEQRIERRLKEEETFAEPVISGLERYFNLGFRGKRVLVVGAGTGAELFALQDRGADVHGLEPYAPGAEILRMKAARRGLDADRIVEGVAEALPYPDGYFDYIHCYTVLEHVEDVQKALDEMVRVCAPGGSLFLETPNYRMPFEPHYKIFMPTFLPRPLLKLYLALRGRPTGFLDTLNFIRPARVLGHLRRKDLTCLRILHRIAPDFARKRNYQYLMMSLFGIERDLWVLVRKDPQRMAAA